MLNRLSLTKKTILGFSVVLFLMLIVAGVAWRGINSSADGFDRYRQMARESNLGSEMRMAMLQSRLAVRNFSIYADDQSLTTFDDRYGKVTAAIEKAKSQFTDPERRELLDQFQASSSSFAGAFAEIVKNRKQRILLKDGVLDIEGPKVATNLDTIVQSAVKDDNTAVAVRASVSLNKMMDAQIGLYDFFDPTSPEDGARVLKALSELNQQMVELEPLVTKPELREAYLQAQTSFKAYADAFTAVKKSVDTEKSLTLTQIDVIGPAIGKVGEELIASLTADQDQLGPQVKASNQATQFTVALVSIVGLVLGIVIAVLLSRAIIKPIRKVMTILNSVAAGDLRQRLTVESQDEIGAMSNSLNTVVQQLQTAMISLSANADDIARSAGDMNQTADSMALVSTDTKSQSTSAAAASEEMSANMRTISASATQMSSNMDSVASAVEEMSISINEIARNTEQANQVADEANHLAEGSRARLGQLGDAASEIGKVVELIQDIAEQTNLLALNATIEAARAGDAGKGFAVVAEEVKQLARQTANATEDIRKRVDGMQSASYESIESIDSIRKVVSNLSQISRGIAAAVEQQSTATHEIANNVSQSSTAARQVSQAVTESAAAGEEISRNVISVDEGARKVSDDAGRTKVSSVQLADISKKLQSLVGQFQV